VGVGGVAAARVGAHTGATVRVAWEGGECVTTVRVRGELPPGAVGLPRGIDGVPPFDPGTACRVTVEG